MGSIDLDPATSKEANRIVKAWNFYTVHDSGLEHEWFGNIWLNPPYAQPAIKQFAEKVKSEVETKRVKQICILVNNATETGWFQSLLSVADAICLVNKRIRFLDANLNPVGTPLQGQIILYSGYQADKFKQIFSQFGKVL